MQSIDARFSTESLADKVTIITTTSPIKSNPRTDIIETSMASIYAIPSLRDCPQIIVFDGIDEEASNIDVKKRNYEEYKRRLVEIKEKSLKPYFKNTTFLFLDTWHHQALALREAMKLVKTPFVFLHQHDVVIVKNFDAVGLVRTMEENPTIKLVRLCNGENSPNWYDGPVDDKIRGIHYIPLVRSFRFADSEHFTTVKYYQDLVFPRVNGRNFAEYWMMEPNYKEHQQDMIDNHDLYGTYVYGKLGEPSYLRHLDGRNTE